MLPWCTISPDAFEDFRVCLSETCSIGLHELSTADWRVVGDLPYFDSIYYSDIYHSPCATDSAELGWLAGVDSLVCCAAFAATRMAQFLCPSE